MTADYSTLFDGEIIDVLDVDTALENLAYELDGLLGGEPADRDDALGLEAIDLNVPSIGSIMNRHGAHIAIDKKLLQGIHHYRVAFASQNEDHAKFFGGNLYGVNPVRFKTSDRLDWTDNLLGLDEHGIRQEIIKLPTVKETWVRGTDVMNISCCWLAHRILISNLSPNDKQVGMMDCFLVFQYKLITSLMAHYFKYPTDEATANAVYAALSKKFAIKQYGTWQAMLEARCRDIIDRRSIHYRTLERFNDDGSIQYLITDVQGRLRAVMKKLYQVFLAVRAADAKIYTSGTMVEIDGKLVVKDVARNFVVYKRYIFDVMADRQRFIKPELMNVIGHVMHTMSEKQLAEALAFITENQGKGSSGKLIESFTDEVLQHAFNYLLNDRGGFERSGDLVAVAAKLRTLFMSSKSTDPSLLKIREMGENLLHKAIATRSPAAIAAVRTGLYLYIVLRTLSKSYYN